MPLKILLIDTDPDRARALEEKLTESAFADVVRMPQGYDLPSAVENAKPDLIIIDMSLPDRDALEDVRAVSASRPIVMFAGTDDPSFVEEAIAAGVCSYNLSGVSFQDIKPIMSAAIALFRRYSRVENELAAAKAMLDERRLIERAKAILMRDRKMTEPEAYRWLQRKAMNENRKLADVVAEILKQEEADARRA
ncbi:MAG: ANTAR domain-containing protein [Alphaproteobacteria bacterium]|nr:ANTAR domain-containing protein [Alphaproteobacteria bacterium]MDE2112977.1 ANTAR domain-containing protein [Alphaproteobacteria bacterium]MDE2492312.1 ANTAR domain-containing protein [Alphaproteobacteria bacterium]